MAEKLKVLFLCTGNSCRSQMAEDWARHLKSREVDVYSAGIEVHGLDPDAVGHGGGRCGYLREQLKAH